MEFLVNLGNILAGNDWRYIAIGIAALGMAGSGIGEGLICAKALEGMSRNPEMYSKLRSSMILACALDETTGIYALVVCILCLFVGYYE